MNHVISPPGRSPADHRRVFEEFGVLLLLVVADHLAMRKLSPRLRVVR